MPQMPYTKVTAIENEAFSENQISSIKLPSSVETFGRWAFRGNLINGVLDLNSLTKLTTIKDYAFADNEVTTIKLPSSIETIERNAFHKGSTSNMNLTTIVNPSGKEFDWTNIVGSNILGQSFATGTVQHHYGNIEVKAE